MATAQGDREHMVDRPGPLPTPPAHVPPPGERGRPQLPPARRLDPSRHVL